MEPFEYLIVMTSVVLGLGISHLLADLTRLIEGRERVRFYWLSIVWAFTLLMQHLQMWWVLFRYQNIVEWNFFSFLLLLLPAMLLYTATVLVLPEFDTAKGIDLRQHYYRNHRWFLGIAAATMVLLSLRAVSLRGFAVFDATSNVRHLAALVFIVGAIIRAPTYHAFVALFSLALFLFQLVRFTLQLE